MNADEILEALANSEEKLQDIDFETAANIASLIIERRESFQMLLGRLASELKDKFGERADLKLADAVMEITGRKISPSTMRQYAIVYKATQPLNLPPDISYTARRLLTETGNPQEWWNTAQLQGWSTSEITREIRNYLQKSKPKRVCKVCGAEQ